MPLVKSDDINIYYEAYGKGETIVYLQSPFGGINPGAIFFAGRLSLRHRVIIWDSPNCGNSGICIKDAPSEWHLSCYYLKALLETLGETSVHIAGCSGGGEMGLLFTHLYGDMVKSLAMYRPTDTTSSVEKEVSRARYRTIAEVAESASMEDVVRFSQNPPSTRFSGITKWFFNIYNKDRKAFDDLDGKKISALLNKWADYMENPMFYRANMNNDELAKIEIPVLVAPCADEFHTEEIAMDLCRNLPNAKYIPSPSARKENEIYGAILEEHPFGGFAKFVDDYNGFIISLSNSH